MPVWVRRGNPDSGARKTGEEIGQQGLVVARGNLWALQRRGCGSLLTFPPRKIMWKL